jgi:hypothetical protein
MRSQALSITASGAEIIPLLVNELIAFGATSKDGKGNHFPMISKNLPSSSVLVEIKRSLVLPLNKAVNA